MADQTNDSVTSLLNSSKDSLAFMGNVSTAKIVEEQTMHQVFRLDAEKGNFYVKIGKPTDKDHGKKEMETEAAWYKRFRDDFKIQDAPDAIYAALANDVHVMAVEEVLGETYDKTLLRANGFSELSPIIKEIMGASAELSSKGLDAYLRDKQGTPAFFGEFNEGECSFVNGRTLKILRSSLKPEAAEKISCLESALKHVAPFATDEKVMSFYRDSIPLNWIKSAKSGKPVPIDLGSTSYRPVQFELVALIETPKCGLDALTEDERDCFVEQRWCIDQMQKAGKTAFDSLFQMASYLKNWSGVASRIQHIKTNLENISKGTDAEMHNKRLGGNIEGRDFHIARALAANSKMLARGYVEARCFNATRDFLEELKQGKYI